MSRIIILIKYIRNNIEHLIHPNNMNEIYMDGSPVSKETAHSAAVVVMMFLVTIALFTIIFMLCGIDSLESLEVVMAMVTSFGTVGVDIAGMHPFLKILMVIMMWAGRLEIIIALAIISPRVWKEHIRDTKAKLRAQKV